jgi:thiol-disulfide isomerase/thioredoxin
MRTLLATLVVLALLAGPTALADDPPTTPAPAPGAEEEKDEGEEPAEPAALPTPKDAWDQLQEAVRAAPPPERRKLLAEKATEYLAKVAEAGMGYTGEEVFHLARFQLTAERHADAVASLKVVVENGDLAASVRDEAAGVLGQLLGADPIREKLPAEGLASAEAAVLAHLGRHEGGPGRGPLHWGAAGIHEAHGRKAEAEACRLQAAKDDAKYAAPAAQAYVRGLLHGVVDPEGYEALRAKAAEVLGGLADLQKAEVEAARASGDAARLQRAEQGLKIVEGAAKPLDLLGREPEPWTVVHAWSETKTLADLKGKVVVVDFWATWCPWCIRSFPAIRELLRDYREQGLEFLGVTATAGSVFPHRYDLDEDLKAKADGPSPSFRRAGRGPAGENVLEGEAYETKEREVIGEFIVNHGMDWPVVMIDAEEPAAKYALQGWPHALVIDRAGRVRHVKSGALLKDRAEAMKEFRALIERLLAEPAPESE